VETGEVRNVPLELKYTPDIPKGAMVIHAGRLFDGRSPTVRSNVDIVIEGNRIRSVEPHSDRRHANGVRVVDAGNLTAMPGLIESHTHLQKDFGEAGDRAWLAFGITTVRSLASTPYEAVEDREAMEAGVRPGPRVYATGYLMEWMRVYYKMGVAISGPAHFEMELERARALKHDFIKSYVRLPDLQQKRMVEFAHAIGIPVATHEIYPAAFVGADNTEHTSGTSRRGYSMKIATLEGSYQDVIQLIAKSGRIFCPTMVTSGSPAGLEKLLEDELGLRNDPRLDLYPQWMRAQLSSPRRGRSGRNEAVNGLGYGAGNGKMVMDVMKAGGRIVAGTDSPNALTLHGELMDFVLSGMTPYEALRTATVNAAEALGLEAGSIEAGKLADIVMVDGNPLENIADAHKVKLVVANGRVFGLDDLAKGPAR